jgi:hypothetical protein
MNCNPTKESEKTANALAEVSRLGREKLPGGVPKVKGRVQVAAPAFISKAETCLCSVGYPSSEVLPRHSR